MISTPRGFSNAELAKEAQREVKLRERLYPRWVGQGRMTQIESEKRIAMMRAILAHLMSCAEADAAKDRLL